MKKITLFLALIFCFASWLNADNIFKAIREGDQKIVQEWLNDSPNITIRNSSGYTILIQAVVSEQWEMARWFLSAGVDKYAVDNAGLTAYDYALEFEQVMRKKLQMQFVIGAVTVAGIVVSIYLYDRYIQQISCFHYPITRGSIPFCSINKDLFYKFPEAVPFSELLK